MPWAAFWLFGRVLGTGWNFDGFWDPPWAPPLGQQIKGWVVKPRSLYLRSQITSWLVPGLPFDRIYTILDWQTDNWGLETGKGLENSRLAD